MSFQSFYIANAVSLANASFCGHTTPKPWVQGKRDVAAVKVATGPATKEGEKKNFLQMLPFDILEYLHPEPVHCFGFPFKKLTYESEMAELNKRLDQAKDYCEQCLSCYQNNSVDEMGWFFIQDPDLIPSTIKDIEAQIEKLKADKERYSHNQKEIKLDIECDPQWLSEVSNGMLKADPFRTKNPYFYLGQPNGPENYRGRTPVAPVCQHCIVVVAKEDYHTIGDTDLYKYTPDRSVPNTPPLPSFVYPIDQELRIWGYKAKVIGFVDNDLREVELDTEDTSVAKAMKIINKSNKNDLITYRDHKKVHGGNVVAIFKADIEFLKAQGNSLYGNQGRFPIVEKWLPKEKVQEEENVSDNVADSRKDRFVGISGYNARVTADLPDDCVEIEFDTRETNFAKAMKFINKLNKRDGIEYSNHKLGDAGTFIAIFKTLPADLDQEEENVHDIDEKPSDIVVADGSRVSVQGYNGITAEKCFNTETQEYHVILCLGDLENMGIMAANKIRKKFEKNRTPGVRFSDEEKHMSMPKRNENSNSWECSVYVQKNLVMDADIMTGTPGA